MEVVYYRTLEGVNLYEEWIDSLADLRAKAAILRLVNNITLDKWGNVKPLRGGIWEIKADVGAGYRVYCFKHKEMIVLFGGDKKSQRDDIKKAQKLKADYLKRLKEEKL